jgi:hypothetical protein
VERRGAGGSVAGTGTGDAGDAMRHASRAAALIQGKMKLVSGC